MSASSNMSSALEKIVHVEIATGAFGPHAIAHAVACSILGTVKIRVVERSARVRAHHLELGDRPLVKAKASVEAARVIVVIDEVVGGCKKSEIAFSANVALEAQHSDVGILVHLAFIIA